MNEYNDTSWYETDDIDNPWLKGDDDDSGEWWNPPNYEEED